MEDRLGELMANGMPRDDAVRLALEEFGDAAGLAGGFVSVFRNRRRRWLMRLTSYSVAATVLLAAGLAIIWPGRNAGPGVAMVSAQVANAPGDKADETRAGAANPGVAQALNRRMDIHYSETPLKDVAAHLTTETGVTFHLKRKKLEEASLSPDTPITCQFRNIRLSTFLELMLDELELTYVERDGLILITTPEDAESRLEVRVYDCRDLLAMPTPDLEKKSGPTAIQSSDALAAALRPNDGKAESSKSGSGGAFGALAAQDKPERPLTEYETRTESLMDIVMAIVDPNSWDDVGGPGAIEAYNGLIAVSHTDETHRMVEQFFDMLRQAAGLDTSKAGRVVRKDGV
jgi:hypothetical protein